MAIVVSPPIWYPTGDADTGPAYDLRKVERWNLSPTDATRVLVVFESSPNSWISFDKTAFEAAYQAYLNA